MAEAKSGSGLDPKISGLLSWIFAPLSSLIFLVIEKDEFAKFHAWQSLLWGVISFVLGFVLSTVMAFTIILACCAPFAFLLPYIVNIIGAIKAYNGEMWKLPVIGDFAAEQAKK
jgi:uncharacterized membrane protein